MPIFGLDILLIGCGNQKDGGRTKLQKSLHLVGCYAQLDLGEEYIRNTEEEKYLNTKKELEARLVELMAGRAAEEIVFETVTTGAANDIQPVSYTHLTDHALCDSAPGFEEHHAPDWQQPDYQYQGQLRALCYRRHGAAV